MRAKKKGKNQFFLLTGTGRTPASYALEMKDGLRRAIDRRELSVSTSPSFRCRTALPRYAQPYWYSPGMALAALHLHPHRF